MQPSLPIGAGVISGRLTLVTKPGVVAGTGDVELREGPGAMGSRSACHAADPDVRQGRQRSACIKSRLGNDMTYLCLGGGP